MTLIVTPGDPNADSYVSLADCLTYATNHGLAFEGGAGVASAGLTGEQALRRATAWIDGTYRYRFAGLRVGLRAQALEWPRYDVADLLGNYVDFTTIPIEVVKATSEAACREYAAPGTLSPDLDRGGQVKSLKAGPVQIVYGANATALPLFVAIEGILGALLSQTNSFTSSGMRA
jgi:hypothetical protein